MTVDVSPATSQPVSRSTDGNQAFISVDRNVTPWRVTCSGYWSVSKISHADKQLRALEGENTPGLVVDTNAMANLDTSGAWLIERLRRSTAAAGKSFKQIDNNQQRLDLVKVVSVFEDRDGEEVNRSVASSNIVLRFLDRLGRLVEEYVRDFVTGCYLIGTAVRGPQLKAGHSRGIRIKSILNQLDQMGWRAIPVIAVMSFLIGGIIAQQGAYQLRQFGEELLAVNLVAILQFREIGVLLTAIMVAGRSGSAITAELGIMKMREEIDALYVMGLNPTGVLILPRLTALVIALPILTVLSDVSGIFGAMVIMKFYVGIEFTQFIEVLREGNWSNTVMAGLIKAPFMAIIIGLTASVEGMKVGGSSESLGRHTTASVVRSIFAVILVDGLFALFFAAIGY